MKVEKAGMGDIEALVKMRLCYLIEDNGSLDAQDLAAIKRDLPGYFQAHLDKDLFIYVIRDRQNLIWRVCRMTVEKAGTEDVEALVKMRLNYLIE